VAAALGDFARRALDAGKSVAVLSAETLPIDHARLKWCRAATDPVQYAHDLYARLRELDASGCDLILVVAPPADGVWSAITDRLKRAAAGSN
jgi:L-threonylcarbamoyladenylate synthase